MNIYEKSNELLVKNLLFIVIICLVILGNKYISLGKNKSTISNDKVRSLSLYKATPMNNSVIDTSSINNQNRIYSSKIVKTYNIEIIVDDIDSIKKKIEKKLQDFDGYFENFYSYDYKNYFAYNISIKIPSDKIDNYLLFLKSNGIIASESFSAVDFTQQYFDNENKLKNLYLRRDRLREMMKTKTDKLSDVLAVDKELNNVQNDIEMLEKNNLNIQNKVDYSDLNLTLKPKILQNKNDISWSLKGVFKDAISILILTVHIIIQYIAVFIVFVPLMVLFFVLGILCKKIYSYLKKCIKQ